MVPPQSRRDNLITLAFHGPWAKTSSAYFHHQQSHELQNHGEELRVSVDKEATLFVHGVLEAALQRMGCSYAGSEGICEMRCRGNERWEGDGGSVCAKDAMPSRNGWK